MSRKTVAIFVDAGFFNRIFTSKIDPEMKIPPEDLAKRMWHCWIRHVDRKNGEDRALATSYPQQNWQGLKERTLFSMQWGDLLKAISPNILTA